MIAAIHAIAFDAMVGGLISAGVGLVAGGVTYENGNVSWDWSGAAEGFMWGSITGVVSGALGSGLSNIGNGLSKLGYAATQGLINAGISGGLYTIQGLATNSFNPGDLAISIGFGLVGGSLGVTKFGKGIRNAAVSLGLGIAESSIGEMKEYNNSQLNNKILYILKFMR